MDVDGKGSKAGSKAKDDESSSESSSDEDDGRPKRPALPAAHTFGDDPSTFPDPTVYEIRPVTPGMSEEEKKQIYSVASYPKSDLSDLIAGDPPDKDFSNAKPSNQISFSTFASYIEPYFRPFTEEDLSFLRDRGDRVTPFNMPARGKRHYTEIWAEEDGTGPFDTPPPPPGGSHEPPNQARGSIDLMDDATAETDQLSVGPILARLLQTMRPEHRPPPADGDTVTAVPLPPYAGVVNGASSSFHDANGEDTTMVNGGDSQGAGGDGSNGILQLQPATYMAESATDVWKRPTGPKLEYSQLDERVKQELRHIGFLDAATTASPLSRLPDNLTNPNNPFPADYDGHYDDEVSARLRELQRRLRDQMLINGARKARLTELVKEHMAHQEYTTILEDLDGQVNGAYHKRTRTMGKSKKAKRPGGAGGGSHYVGGAGSGVGVASASGTARPGLGDATKLLLERRRRWIDNIGAVFEDVNLTKVPRADPKDGGGPETTIFKKEIMADLLRQERQAWEEEKALEEDEE